MGHSRCSWHPGRGAPRGTQAPEARAASEGLLGLTSRASPSPCCLRERAGIGEGGDTRW